MNDKGDIILHDILPRTPANRIPKWKSTLRFACLLSTNSTPVDSIHEISDVISEGRNSRLKSLSFRFALAEKSRSTSLSHATQLGFDQFATIACQHNATINNSMP